MPVKHVTVETQGKALLLAAQIAAKGSLVESVRLAAAKITYRCEKNDGYCQLERIYEAVKDGTPLVKGLKNGVKYLRDPILSDHFMAPARLLKVCAEDPEHCAEDCDGHAMLIAAMAASIGLRSGLRAFKPEGSRHFTHVYAVVCPDFSDARRGKDLELLGMDTTVSYASVGWQPSPGKTMTIMLEDTL